MKAAEGKGKEGMLKIKISERNAGVKGRRGERKEGNW